jgi:hypothetical protein
MRLTWRGTAVRVVLIGVLLAFPRWYPPLMRRIDTQMSRRELAAEAEREARAGGEIFRGPSGETMRAVVYTPAGPDDAATIRSMTWLLRLVALTLIVQLVASLYATPEELTEAD